MPPRRLLLVLPLLTASLSPLRAQPVDPAPLAARAARVTIVRDDWGIAHVHGPTDADAVFGMIYAQCEDDFNRVETNYLAALGRLAEAEGEARLWQDLRRRLFLDPEELRAAYAKSPDWLRRLMDAWADGLNYYLFTHPEVKPRVLTHWEPWMALSFTEGSIGGDLEKISLPQLAAFYGTAPVVPTPGPRVTRAALPGDELRAAPVALGDGGPGGSNGAAIAPANTRNHHALLLINPHTSFFFRSELQMTSDEGLNAYGAATWGQFFLYQGFNERAGWMHTTSGVDAVDEFRETVAAGTPPLYRHGDQLRPFATAAVVLRWKGPDGTLRSRSFTTYRNAHGPVTRRTDDGWITTSLMNKPVAALEQSYRRTRARTYQEYRDTMELRANSSNNTLFAAADGDIAYWHGDFIPRRDPRFDYTKPVDGTDPAADWQGLHPLAEVPQLRNPASGFFFNVNNAPWWGAGASSLRAADFPAYVEQGAETARGLHARRVFEGRRDFTLESLLGAAFDSYLPWFEPTIPALVRAQAAEAADSRYADLADSVALLRAWDCRWGVDSVATTLAVYWGTALQEASGLNARASNLKFRDYVATQAGPDFLLNGLLEARRRLISDFGSDRVRWGDVNRFQRLTGDLVQPFQDAGASIPVGFTWAVWGSLASFEAHPYPGTRKWYGTSGNSFVAVVEFGEKVRALAVTAGGGSGHPGSPHFNDQASRYAAGNLREVYFYPEQLAGHTERTYHPGG